MRVCTPNSTLKIYFFAKHIQLQNLKYLSKTTVFQIVDYICTVSLKVLDTGSLQIFENPNSQASCAKKIILNAFPFFWVKWVYHKLCIFQFQIFYTNWPSLILIHPQVTIKMVLQLLTYCLALTMVVQRLYIFVVQWLQWLCKGYNCCATVTVQSLFKGYRYICCETVTIVVQRL